jgi:predicted transcriptional regulator
MSTDRKQEARERTQMLLELRKQYSENVRRGQEILKTQQAVRKLIRRALHDGPQSVPQLAAQTGMPAHDVLWHIAAMKKYGLVEEAGANESGEYFLYGLPQEAKR